MELADLQRANINADVAREVYVQAEKRLADTLETKDSHDKKAFEMLRAYVALSLAAFSVTGVLLNGSGPASGLPFFLTGLAFTVGAGVVLFSLRGKPYGATGSDPSMWLVPTVIDCHDKRIVPVMLATLAFLHEERIQEGRASNRRKAELNMVAVCIGAATPVLLGLGFLLGR